MSDNNNNKKKNKKVDKFSEEYIKKERTFPTKNTVILVILVAVQIIILIYAINYKPALQDLIKEYDITVTANEDGTLDAEYRFLWQAIDPSEELTWVEIGMPNPTFKVDGYSFSGNVAKYTRIIDEGYTALQIDFKKGYKGGETVEFYFKVNFDNMLCQNGDKVMYDFIPGWFNRIPVEKYTFKWKQDDRIISSNAGKTLDGSLVWTGSLDCGEYVHMILGFDPEKAKDLSTVLFQKFDDEGAYNELEEERFGTVGIAIFACIVIAVAELFIIDSYVSYVRGRGFLSGYGHPVHTYGRSNPAYIREYNDHRASSGGGRGGGCACACACACAGGGRAGCSQKDTYVYTPKNNGKKRSIFDQ